MARVFRQQYTQQTPGGERATRQSAKWYVEYRDAQGVRHRVPGYTDKSATQQLARHSTITLTMDRYSHTVLGELSDALSALPELSAATPEREQQRATGT